MENKFGYNRHKYFAEYIKEEPKKTKKESEPIEVTPWIAAAVFAIVAIIMGFFIYNYLQELKLEESPLKVGQIWEEEVIRIPEFRTELETLYISIQMQQTFKESMCIIPQHDSDPMNPEKRSKQTN